MEECKVWLLARVPFCIRTQCGGGWWWWLALRNFKAIFKKFLSGNVSFSVWCVWGGSSPADAVRTYGGRETGEIVTFRRSSPVSNFGYISLRIEKSILAESCFLLLVCVLTVLVDSFEFDFFIIILMADRVVGFDSPGLDASRFIDPLAGDRRLICMSPSLFCLTSAFWFSLQCSNVQTCLTRIIELWISLTSRP
jgi:hypothetical protein